MRLSTPKQTIVLTPDGRAAVKRVASYYRAIKSQYLQNSLGHVLHHFSFLPAALVLYACGVPTHDDLSQLVQLGYAEVAP